ncbi:unnamed protein product [Caenorhabditis bovis]|uniref:Uncharacterized protein n=1 Tax=Caenorhabditis bovis TaxID=2654633 RepID=A0A8S1F9D4_9PELO|nr:unnamed protein product [Caenorhabditis bovis]
MLKFNYVTINHQFINGMINNVFDLSLIEVLSLVLCNVELNEAQFFNFAKSMKLHTLDLEDTTFNPSIISDRLFIGMPLLKQFRIYNENILVRLTAITDALFQHWTRRNASHPRCVQFRNCALGISTMVLNAFHNKLIDVSKSVTFITDPFFSYSIELKLLPDSIIRERLHIEQLDLSNNFLNENAFNMPIFPHLKFLSVRNNKLFRSDATFLVNIRKNCPALEELIIENNPAWPTKTDVQNLLKFRAAIIENLKNLKSLNGLDTYRRTRSTCSDSSSEASN